MKTHPSVIATLAAPVLLASLLAMAAADTVKRAEPLQPVRFNAIKIHGFWKDQVKRLTQKWIPHCMAQMEEGGRGRELMNLVYTAQVLGDKEASGKFTGLPWSDAYIYNTMEAACLALAADPEGDEELAAAQDRLRKKMEEWIPIILAAQCADGYIHSFHVVNKRPRYTNTQHHEFYVQGYFIEMGIAHYRATNGKDRRLYDAARKCADGLCETFGPEPRRMWKHGHPGMGHALSRLARLVNESEGDGKGNKYFELAKFLLDNRHKGGGRPYDQSHMPVVDMDEAVGHAVRATYFYTAMADLAGLTGDPAYLKAVDKIWDNAVHRKMYITGGAGASHRGEAFDVDYELRNSGYCESCAGCGLSFWADSMHRIHKRGHEMDVFERVLYNNILGAIDLAGRNFYYQNPLESSRGRHPWHVCPCCVGNIPRALLALKDRMYSLNREKDTLYVNHFMASEGTIADVAGASLTIAQETEYPWKGDVSITLKPAESRRFTVKIRVPDRTGSALYRAKPEPDAILAVTVNGEQAEIVAEDGYAALDRTWKAGDRIAFSLPLEVQRVYCDERVKANAGRVALQRGPLVYNIESVDYDGDVRELVLPPEADLRAVWKGDLLGGVMAIECNHPKLLAVPNYARLNRGGWSQVWVLENPEP